MKWPCKKIYIKILSQSSTNVKIKRYKHTIFCSFTSFSIAIMPNRDLFEVARIT